MSGVAEILVLPGKQRALQFRFSSAMKYLLYRAPHYLLVLPAQERSDPNG